MRKLFAAALLTNLSASLPCLAQTSSAVPLQPAPISLEQARRVLETAERQAGALHAPSSIAVADTSGDLVLFEQMDGARQAGITLSMGKARTAARYRATTDTLESKINGGRGAAITAGFVQMRGGVPIVAAGRIIGAVGVSGVDNNNDVQVATAAAAAVAP